jgi:glutaredoxin-like protein
MELLKDRDREAIEAAFRDLDGDVKIKMFTQQMECQFCAVTRGMVEQLASMSDKIHAEIHDFVEDQDLAVDYGVDKIPAILLLGEKDYGIRFFGVPAGYEFSSLLEGILDLSRRDPKLPAAVREDLAKLDQPVHLQVLITPT